MHRSRIHHALTSKGFWQHWRRRRRRGLLADESRQVSCIISLVGSKLVLGYPVECSQQRARYSPWHRRSLDTAKELNMIQTVTSCYIPVFENVSVHKRIVFPLKNMTHMTNKWKIPLTQWPLGGTALRDLRSPNSHRSPKSKSETLPMTFENPEVKESRRASRACTVM